MVSYRLALSGLGLALLAACSGAPIRPVASPSIPPSPPDSPFRAGVAEVDVTPHPGLGTFGHGPNAAEGRGHRGRLHCRVFYLEDGRGQRVALVPCDFAAMDVHLQRLVARKVRADARLGSARIVMTATHTHGGPGNYFFSNGYSGMFSGEANGYDAAYTDDLATRVAAGIDAAFASAGPARIAWASASLNTGDDGSGPSIGQNRSVYAHCANSDPMHGAPTSCDAGVPDPVREVTGRLSLLRIDRVLEGGSTAPLGLYATYPVHGTAVPNTNRFFEADLWGFAVRHLEVELGAGAPFVAGLANAAEGDVRPTADPSGWDEARRVGELLATRIATVYRGITTFESNPTIDVTYRDLALADVAVPGTDHRTCATPEYGAGAPGGSEEGRTCLYGAMLHEGRRGRNAPDCRPNHRGFILSNGVHGRLPRVAPLMLVGIGHGVLAALPWEATTTAGLRIEDEIARRVPGEVVGIAGLANEYLQYLTTSEEYLEQNYEGASNIFGAYTLDLVKHAFGELADALLVVRTSGVPSIDEATIEHRKRPRRHTRFDPDAEALPPRVDEDHSGRTVFEDHDAVVVRFAAGEPGSLGIANGAIVRVEVRDASGTFVPATHRGRPVDDTSEDVVVEWLHARRRRARRIFSVNPPLPEGVSRRDYHDLYEARWIPPDDMPGGTYRLVVRSAGVERAARAFTWPSARVPR